MIGDVALYTSAWIEIDRTILDNFDMWVALYTSAWIEMFGLCGRPS